MPKTESLLPSVSASSCEEKGMRRAKACSTSTVVDSPEEEKRGRNCTRVKSIKGAVGAT